MPPGPGVFPGRRDAAVECILRAAMDSTVRHPRVAAGIEKEGEFTRCNCFSRQSTIWPAGAALASIVRADISNPHSNAPTLGVGRF